MLIVSLAIAAVTGACGGAADPTSDVEQALREADLPAVNVEWDDDARVARLQGSVDSSVERDRAEQVAAAAVGTTGSVLNEVSVRGIDPGVLDDLDDEIENNIEELFGNDATLRDRELDVEVNNGAVIVRGNVRSAAEKARVTEIVQSAAGVKDFANALEIEAER